MTSLGPPALPEAKVLAPRDPRNTNSDDWPEFRLSEAIATVPGSRDGEPVSLLLASEHFPLAVTGRLAPPGPGQEHLWQREDGGKKGALITIGDVRSFAYGSYNDGSVEIWAAGNAGWFVIQPGRAYRQTYVTMCAAVKMLFFAVDAYTEPIAKTKGKSATQTWSEPSPERFFARYARQQLKDEARTAEAAEAVYQHRDFLLSSMLAGKEGMAWSRNPLYRHLANKFPDDLQAIRERMAPKRIAASRSDQRHESQDALSTSSSLKRKRGRPPKDKPIDVISIGSRSAASSVQRRDSTKRGATARTLPTRQTRQNSQSIATQSETPEIRQSATPAQTDSDDDEEEDVPPRAAGKGKSALRLKPSKPIKGPPKGPARSGKAPSFDDDEPRSSPLPVKRRADDVTHDIRRSKRRNSKAEPEEDEGIDIPTSPSSHSTPGDLDPDTEAGAAAANPNHPSLADSLAAHKPDPIQESTWQCALDGCTHKVYGDPSDPTSQRLIREHYALHAYDDDERVQLVRRLQAPSLPVMHLMERARLQAKGEGFPGSKVAGTRFPEPLRTRF